MAEKLKILFVCTINRMRSATAQVIYENDVRFEVKSAGTDKSARVVIDRELLDWTDAIVVMEKYHRNKIRSKFPDIYSTKRIVCLYIPDDYAFMDEVLINLLQTKFEDIYRRGLLSEQAEQVSEID